MQRAWRLLRLRSRSKYVGSLAVEPSEQLPIGDVPPLFEQQAGDCEYSHLDRIIRGVPQIECTVNRALRLLSIGLATLFGSLGLFAISGHIGWMAGEAGASLWFIGCAVLSGYVAHRLLPRGDTTGLVSKSMIVVQCGETTLTCARPDGKVEKVDWDDLQRVEIVTTDEGPWNPDVFWVLHGSESGCLVPQGATGERELLERLEKLPGFDNTEFIRAMGCTSNERFHLWSSDQA